jgi:hypothetical protein
LSLAFFESGLECPIEEVRAMAEKRLGKDVLLLSHNYLDQRSMIHRNQGTFPNS